ncbi:MAG: hypothetical protein ACTHMC_07385 [Pseudobacter sp.]|uniref:hypothetical protein n=1 Tax=Pseudobacter sp. TaxID=2045420 RepID=UPI003F814A01
MKKLLFVFAVAAFAACNDSATTEAPKADTTAAPVQTAPDSSALSTDSSALKADSTVKADTSKPAPAAH